LPMLNTQKVRIDVQLFEVSSAYGQNQSMRRQMSLPLPGGRGSLPGWRSTLPTIWREAPANPVNAMHLTYRAV
ncbi:MAG TPA: hypothetical protein VN798_09625, partial [Pseudomonas sp.]|nr:hypothetical protein [Pseudomonas sp.]